MARELSTSELAAAKGDRITRIAVIGSGAWGTALACVAARAGRDVTIWGRDPAVIEEIAQRHTNEGYLPGVALPERIGATVDLGAACKDAGAILIVTPSRTLREICAALRPHLPPGVPIALCCKGIETGTGLLMSQVAEQELPGHPVGALSGPTFAVEAARGFLTAATVAFPFTYQDRLHPGDSAATRVALAMGSEDFRPYISNDLTGVEIGGAMKNVIAIACGMLTRRGLTARTCARP